MRKDSTVTACGPLAPGTVTRPPGTRTSSQVSRWPGRESRTISWAASGGAARSVAKSAARGMYEQVAGIGRSYPECAPMPIVQPMATAPNSVPDDDGPYAPEPEPRDLGMG